MKQKTRWAIEKATPYLQLRASKEPNGFKQMTIPPVYRAAVQAGLSLGLYKRHWEDGDAMITMVDPAMGVGSLKDSPKPHGTPTLVEKSPETKAIEQALLYVKHETEKKNIEALPFVSSPVQYHKGINLALNKGLLHRFWKKGSDYLSLTTQGETAAYEVNNPEPEKTKPNFKIRPHKGDFMLDRGDLRKLAKTLPKADYILKRINEIPVGDNAALGQLRDAICKHYDVAIDE
jgi:hypothetical protein